MSKEPQLGTCRYHFGSSDQRSGMGLPAHQVTAGCMEWKPSPLPTDRATEQEEPTVEYRVVAEWTDQQSVVGLYDSLDDAKDHVRRLAKLYDPTDLKAAWIETRTVTPWTKL